MVKLAIEIISLLLFLAFFAWLMYIILKGIWNSFGDKKFEEKYNELLNQYNSLKIENQNLIDRITSLESLLEKVEKESTKKVSTKRKVSKRYE